MFLGEKDILNKNKLLIKFKFLRSALFVCRLLKICSFALFIYFDIPLVCIYLLTSKKKSTEFFYLIKHITLVYKEIEASTKIPVFT